MDNSKPYFRKSSVEENLSFSLENFQKYNVEGNKFHMNKTEHDITTPLGIYRGSNKNASIFTTVEEWFKKLTGKTKATKDYTKEDLDVLNKAYEENKEFRTEIDKESVVFYKKYISKINMEGVDIYLFYAFFNIYVNSKKIAVKALQMTYYDLILKQDYDKKVCDGLYGPNTEKMLRKVIEHNNTKDSLIARLTMCAYLKNVVTCYVEICTDNGREDAQLPNLRGWINRVNNIYKCLLKY